VWSTESQPKFRREISPQFHGWILSQAKNKQSFVYFLFHSGFLSDLFLDPEDGAKMFLRNVGWHIQGVLSQNTERFKSYILQTASNNILKTSNWGNMNLIWMYQVGWRRGEALGWGSADFDSDLGWDTGYPEVCRGVHQLIQANVRTAATLNGDGFVPNSPQFNNHPYQPYHTFQIPTGP
jgi:hypothetical protein